MNLNNILAIMWNDFKVVRRVKWRLIEITYFPITTILIWGLFAIYSRQYATEAGLIVLIVNLFWSFSELAQQQANILIMEDLWTLSIKHILVSGISVFEYIIAKILTSAIVAVAITTVLLIIANAFGAPLLNNLGYVISLAGIALLGSISLAIIVAGTVILAGREYGFLSWSSLHLFVFLSAPFFPAGVFPSSIRWITEIMPFTYVFQGARALATQAIMPSGLLSHAFIVALAYFVLSWPFYAWAVRRAKKTGTLARMTH